jgi:hypothetical protein
VNQVNDCAPFNRPARAGAVMSSAGERALGINKTLTRQAIEQGAGAFRFVRQILSAARAQSVGGEQCFSLGQIRS